MTRSIVQFIDDVQAEIELGFNTVNDAITDYLYNPNSQSPNSHWLLWLLLATAILAGAFLAGYIHGVLTA